MTGLASVTVADVYVPVGTALRSMSWCNPLSCAKSTTCGALRTETLVVPLFKVTPVTMIWQEITLGKGASVPMVKTEPWPVVPGLEAEDDPPQLQRPSAARNTKNTPVALRFPMMILLHPVDDCW